MKDLDIRSYRKFMAVVPQDSISEAKIQDSLEILTKGKTTFVVAHRLSTIKNADKIVVLKDGKVDDIGSYAQLMDKKGEFYKLKRLQS